MTEMQYCSIRALTIAVLGAVLLGLPGGPGMPAAWADTDFQWAWMKGPAAVNQPGTYGAPGTPAAGNSPGARENAVSWTDASGALWLFGGFGYDSAGSGNYLNDLWKYDRLTGNWAWMKGANTVYQSGVYGTPGIPAVGNIPGARQSAVSWIDSAGALWLFGGYGLDAAGTQGTLNDLWKYDPVTGYWAWMKGANTVNQYGVYGTPGTPATDNTPGGHYEAVSWTDPSGMLWLFGGFAYDSAGNSGTVNDLWKYDPATGNWAWMKGADTINQLGTYGTSGTPAAANTPGARHQAVSWTDPSGGLWLFGGYGQGESDGLSWLNDVWKYDRSTGRWAWMKGAKTTAQPGTYGTSGTPAPANTPGACDAAVSWIDASGALWLFGGLGYDGGVGWGRLNDLWRWQDAVPPTGAIVINSNHTATKTSSVTLALTWSDGAGSGVSRMRFSNDGSTWSAWEVPTATRAYALPGTDGYKTVRVQYIDKAGNRSLVYNDYIRLDTVPPTGGITINHGAATTTSRSVSLGLTWADTGSGVTRMRFSDNGSTWTVWESQKATRAYTLPAGLGNHTVRVQYTDAAENYSPIYNDYIKLVAP